MCICSTYTHTHMHAYLWKYPCFFVIPNISLTLLQSGLRLVGYKESIKGIYRSIMVVSTCPIYALLPGLIYGISSRS